MGDSQSELGIIHPIKPVFLHGENKANIMDHKPMINIKPFGQCQSILNPVVAAATAANFGKLQPMPCIPNTTMPWIAGKMDVLIKKQPALMNEDKLMCLWAGLIEIVDEGQAD